MENECEALPGVAYPGVRDNRSTLNTKTGYDDDDEYWHFTSLIHILNKNVHLQCDSANPDMLIATEHPRILDKLTHEYQPILTGRIRCRIRRRWHTLQNVTQFVNIYRHKTENKLHYEALFVKLASRAMPLVLRHCWSGGKKCIQPVKTQFGMLAVTISLELGCKWFAYVSQFWLSSLSAPSPLPRAKSRTVCHCGRLANWRHCGNC